MSVFRKDLIDWLVAVPATAKLARQTYGGLMGDNHVE
jgi:hypothetical protein